MWRRVIFNKFTKINASPQLFLSLDEAKGAKLSKTSYVMFAVK